jgi:hypothetical protein
MRRTNLVYIIVWLLLIAGISSCRGTSASYPPEAENELREVYEGYLSARVIAYQSNSILPIQDMISGQELQVTIKHIEDLKVQGVARGEVSTITGFTVLFYGDTIAAIQVNRKYISLKKNERAEDFPNDSGQSDTKRCELVRNTTQEPWKINYCEYVVSDW